MPGQDAAYVTAVPELVAADPCHIGGDLADCRLSRWEIIEANPALILAPR